MKQFDPHANPGMTALAVTFTGGVAILAGKDHANSETAGKPRYALSLYSFPTTNHKDGKIVGGQVNLNLAAARAEYDRLCKLSGRTKVQVFVDRDAKPRAGREFIQVDLATMEPKRGGRVIRYTPQ